MMVTFVSQCEKKALTKTRRVLDSFANRIGDKTWQTVITNEGLRTVKKLLRKTATKNTAVACHWMRGRSRSEVVWVVGNRNKFNSEGLIPVNRTQKNLINIEWENTWNYLPLIKFISALSGLFHDWGKASVLFQQKLIKNEKVPKQGDPLRHEWISCLLFISFVKISGENDKDWLLQLSNGNIDKEQIIETAKTNVKKPFKNLPNLASAISWLILSHHRIPLIQHNDNWKGEAATSLQKMIKRFTSAWGYENHLNDEAQQKRVDECFVFKGGLPSDSALWMKQAKKWATRAIDHLSTLEKTFETYSWRGILLYSRLALMLGDHHHSSGDCDPAWPDQLSLYANTQKDGKLKQKLDEHLIGVEKAALEITHMLPLFEERLDFAQDVKSLKRRANQGSPYYWQDRARDKVLVWKENNKDRIKNQNFGFFTVNIASTGCGKTFENAKIMQALSPDNDSLRYILALGLRTLTLQTGDEYRDKVGLDETELAVLIGSQALLELHQQNSQSASESAESLIEESVDYECNIPETKLFTILGSENNRKLLYAPVLACTIDHIMSATESIRGGRWILPTLRLMSSDLVIDEVDDFSGNDLVAIGRLIHLAGMLGRKVTISSATITPEIAEGYFHSYRAGWAIYSQMRATTLSVGCGWIDEFHTQVETIDDFDLLQASENFRNFHSQFVNKRKEKLRYEERKQGIRRKGEIILFDTKNQEDEDEVALQHRYFEKIKYTVIKLHRRHSSIDPLSKKRVSFGCVRVANINPCIELTEYLLQTDWPDTFEARSMPYHSRQVLLLRSEQEKHLDAVLKCKDDPYREKAFYNPVIRAHIDNSTAQDIAFILVATPVEEIGRDHDFDWAVVEPSSLRSIIQLAGRVRRHRTGRVDRPNVALLQYNLKALKVPDTVPVFCRPGFENSEHRLSTHDLVQLINEKEIRKSINAIPRIGHAEHLDEHTSLADLEHLTISSLLTNYDEIGPESAEGWMGDNCWWLSGMPQHYSRFRQDEPKVTLYLAFYDEELVFGEKDEQGNFVPREKTNNIERIKLDRNIMSRLWLPKDYLVSLEDLNEKLDKGIRYLSYKYGMIEIPERLEDKRLIYNDQFGIKTI